MEGNYRLSIRTLLRLCCVLAALWSAPARAVVVLDWDVYAWSAGSNSQSFDVDPAFPGTDVSLTLTGSVNKFRNDPATNQATPVTNQTVTGGLSPVQNSLLLGVDYHQGSNAIVLTITFSSNYALGVTDVTFSIFGIDQSSSAWQDQIASIYATGVDGSQIAPTITNFGSAVTLTGAGLNHLLTGNATVPDSGAGSEAGNVTLTFGGAIRSVTFTYQDGLGSRPNPTYQEIAVGDITFSPIPEINPAIPGAFGCGVAAAATAVLHRRARRSRERTVGVRSS